MRTFLRRLRVTWVATLLFTLSTSGCVLGVRGDPSSAPEQRPPPREEARGPRPSGCGDECRFASGYWHWDGARYEWISGRWERDGQPVANSPR